MYGEDRASRPSKISKKNKISMLLVHLDSSDEEDSDVDDSFEATQPGHKEFHLWIRTVEAVPEEMGMVEWWQVSCDCPPSCLVFYLLILRSQLNSSHYPVWYSLTLDYLPVMVSSVSSEHAFSARGITISKRHNRLKGDIVKALQVVKCALRKDLLVRLPMPSSQLEQLEEAEDDNEELLCQDSLQKQLKDDPILLKITDTDDEDID